MADPERSFEKEPEMPPLSELAEMRILLRLARTFFPNLLNAAWMRTKPDWGAGTEPPNSKFLRAKAQYQTLIEQIPAVTFIASSSLDDEKSEIYVSPQIESLLGYTAREWLDSPLLWYQRLHPDDKIRLSRDFARTISRDESFRGDYRFLAKDGRTVWVHGEIKIVYDEHGSPSFIHGIGYDITELKRAEEVQREARHAEEKAKLAAEATNRAKDQFLAMLSHELRTPLTPVVSGIEMLLENAPAESRQTIETMRRNLQLEVRLIDDLLDLTRIGKGKLAIKLHPVDAHDAILRAVETCRPHLKHLETKLALDALESNVNADPDRLEQVVRNLLENAARFTPAGGNIEIRTSNSAPGVLQILCLDTGVGIEAADLSRIFKAFEQCERSVKRGYGGLGLGLAISKALVEAHGGSITARSAGHGRGATFEVNLQTVPETLTQNGQNSPAPVAFLPTPKAPSPPCRILLVEDHCDTRLLLARLLKRFGYEVDMAEDARTALDLAGTADFDILISDIGLPDGNGLQLVQSIHERQPIPAIAVSGYGAESDRQQSRDAGYSEHLVKPIDSKRLVETIERLLAVRPSEQ